MKKIIPALILLIIFNTRSHAANFYWVGGTGDWNDFANHWATTSGGSQFHPMQPGPNDDVIFDANSFNSAGNSVSIANTLSFCKSMDWSAATYSPEFIGLQSCTLQVYGSVVLSSNLIWNFSGMMLFKSANSGNIFKTSNLQFTDSTLIIFDGYGEWVLEDNLIFSTQVNLVKLSNGTLNLNGNSVTCFKFMVYPVAANTAHLITGASEINCFEWVVFDMYGTSIIDATGSEISCSIFSDCCNGGTYHDVVATEHNAVNSTFNTVVVGTSNASGNNTYHHATINGIDCRLGQSEIFDTLIFSTHGQTITINGVDSVTINGPLVFVTDPGNPTTLKREAGTANLYCYHDTVCANFLNLQNINAAGTAVYYAGDYSIDLGGNSGWNWTHCSLVSLNEEEFSLPGFHPNPMEQSAQIIFNNPAGEDFLFTIANAFGKVVEKQISRSNTITFERKSLASGVYYYTLVKISGSPVSGKLIIL